MCRSRILGRGGWRSSSDDAANIDILRICRVKDDDDVESREAAGSVDGREVGTEGSLRGRVGEG